MKARIGRAAHCSSKPPAPSFSLWRRRKTAGSQADMQNVQKAHAGTHPLCSFCPFSVIDPSPCRQTCLLLLFSRIYHHRSNQSPEFKIDMVAWVIGEPNSVAFPDCGQLSLDSLLPKKTWDLTSTKAIEVPNLRKLF